MAARNGKPGTGSPATVPGCPAGADPAVWAAMAGQGVSPKMAGAVAMHVAGRKKSAAAQPAPASTPAGARKGI